MLLQASFCSQNISSNWDAVRSAGCSAEALTVLHREPLNCLLKKTAGTKGAITTTNVQRDVRSLAQLLPFLCILWYRAQRRMVEFGKHELSACSWSWDLSVGSWCSFQPEMHEASVCSSLMSEDLRRCCQWRCWAYLIKSDELHVTCSLIPCAARHWHGFSVTSNNRDYF